jgi:hypothetical protein
LADFRLRDSGRRGAGRVGMQRRRRGNPGDGPTLRRLQNANGAGIAADPTLTSAWTSLAPDTSGKPSASLASGHTWRPMSGPDASVSCDTPHRDCSPALAPASGFRYRPAASFSGLNPRILAALRSCLAETDPFSDPGLRRIRTCVLFHHPFRPGFRPVRWLSVAPASSSRLALSRSLLHAFSRQARGQEPPPSLGSKPR